MKNKYEDSTIDDERKRYFREYYHRVIKPKRSKKRMTKKETQEVFKENVNYEKYLEYQELYSLVHSRFKNLFPSSSRRRNLNYLPKPPTQLKKNSKGQIIVDFD